MSRATIIQWLVMSILGGVLLLPLLTPWIVESPWLQASQDRGFVGAHAAEQITGQSVRWLAATSQVRFPSVGAGLTIVEINLTHALIAHIPTQSVVLESEAMPALPIVLTDWRMRRYQVLFDVAPAWRWYVPLHISANSPHVDDTGRSLSVLFHQARMLPTTHSMWWLPRPQIGWIWVIAALAYTAMWRSGSPRHTSMGGTSMLVALATLGWWYSPLEFVSILPWLTVLLVLWWLWWGGARILGWVTPDQSQVPGQYLPALSALGMLGLPVFQQFVMYDGITIAPEWQYPSQPLWAALVATGGGLVGMLLAQWRRAAVLATWIRSWYMPLVLIASGLWATVPRLVGMFGRVSSDFDVWVQAANDWLVQGSCYRVSDIAADLFGYIYKYPPAYCLVFVPFAHIPNSVLIDAYRWLDVGLLLGICAAWIWWQPAPDRLWWLATVTLTLNYAPLVDTFMLAQIDVVVLASVVLLYRCIVRGRDATAGFIIAVLTSLKLYPVVFLVYWVAQQRWRALWAFGGALLGINVVAMLWLGWREYTTFFFDVIPIIGGTTAWRDNQSMYAIVARAVGDMDYLGEFVHPWLYQATTVVALGMLASIVLMQFLVPRADQTHHPVQFGALILWTAFAIPVAWPDYYVPVLLLWWALFGMLKSSTVPLWLASLIMLAYAGIAFGNAMSFVFALPVGIIETLLVSHKAYAGVLMYVVVIIVVWRMRWSLHPQWLSWWQQLRQRVTG